MRLAQNKGMATQRRGPLPFWIASAWIMAGTSAALALWGSGEARKADDLQARLDKAEARALKAESELERRINPPWRLKLNP